MHTRTDISCRRAAVIGRAIDKLCRILCVGCFYNYNVSQFLNCFLAPSLCIAITLVSGCGDSRPPTFVVTGVVTYRGMPVDGALVMFVPMGGRPASGQTDVKGRFTLLSFAPGDGAVAGEHTVCIAKTAPSPIDKNNSPYPQTVMLLPECYATPMQSPLKATVTAQGSNDFRFDLVDGTRQ